MPPRQPTDPTSGARLWGLAPLGLLGLAILVLCHGCGRKPAPAVSSLSPAAPPRQAHVYPAQLMSEHPLYEQYRRLDREIAALRRSCEPPLLSPLAVDLAELTLPGPELTPFPFDRFEASRREWQSGLLPPPMLPSTELPPDLAARLAWAQARAKEATQAQLLAFQSEQDRLVAEVRAEAVRARQEALNNAGLDLTRRERDVGRGKQSERRGRGRPAETTQPPPYAEEPAEPVRRRPSEEERARLWAEIEAEVAVCRAAADARVESCRQRLMEEEARKLAEYGAEFDILMRKRLEISLKSGSETKTRMSNALTLPQQVPSPAPLTWRPSVPIASAVALQPSVPALKASDEQARLEQASRLAKERAKLAREILESVTTATQRLAMREGLTLTFQPGEPPTGRDVTEELRPKLRRMYTQ